jgi:hypothetical protein
MNSKELKYSKDWKKPNSEIRKKITDDINDMVLELTDSRFRFNLSGFTESTEPPHIWIGGKLENGFRGKLNINSDLVYNFINRSKEYLIKQGFKIVKTDFLNKNQLYIYFDIN